MKIALVKNGVVVNTVRGGQEFADSLAADWDAVLVFADDNPVSPGWTVSGQTVSKPADPAPVVPSSVTMRQARLALLGAGKLAAVQEAIDALPEPTKTAAQIEWEYSNEVQRHNGLVAALGPALNLTSDQIDALFIEAAKL